MYHVYLFSFCIKYTVSVHLPLMTEELGLDQIIQTYESFLTASILEFYFNTQ